jgi:hypothetical protein
VKQVIALATGAPVSSFSGGVEANGYLKERGFEIEPLHLPTETETRIALHVERLRTHRMENGNEVSWENRVRFARRKLVDAGVLDGSEYGVWRLQVRQHPCVWVEKAKVEGRPERHQGEHALGKTNCRWVD